VLNHRHIQLSRSLSHWVSQENHLEYHIISTLCTEETSTSFHLRLRENDTPTTWASPHRGTQHSISVSERNHTPSSWASLHRGTQHSISVSERNHTPNSWASSLHTGAHNVPSLSQRETTHPTHGLSLRPTHLVCVLENVSHNCNHQQLVRGVIPLFVLTIVYGNITPCRTHHRERDITGTLRRTATINSQSASREFLDYYQQNILASTEIFLLPQRCTMNSTTPHLAAHTHTHTYIYNYLITKGESLHMIDSIPHSLDLNHNTTNYFVF
jgi:hypothetical protein